MPSSGLSVRFNLRLLIWYPQPEWFYQSNKCNPTLTSEKWHILPCLKINLSVQEFRMVLTLFVVSQAIPRNKTVVNALRQISAWNSSFFPQQEWFQALKATDTWNKRSSKWLFPSVNVPFGETYMLLILRSPQSQMHILILALPKSHLLTRFFISL